MKIQPVSKIVTNCFLVVKRQDNKPVRFEPALDLLVASLVRTAAHKIFVPSNLPSNFPKIEETIKQYPPSLTNKIEVVDRDKKIYRRVSRFLEPVYRETKETSSTIQYNFVFDFLYKLVIASKLQAEADIHQVAQIGHYINMLKEDVEDKEAKIRLDELYGIYYIYQAPKKIDAITLLPKVSHPSIYQRVTNLIDNAEIIELSRNRYFLGIPSKAKIAMIKIRRCIGKILANRRYANQITAATDLIQTVVSTPEVSIPLKSAYEILKNIQISPYNPPLIDLSYFRFKIAKRFDKNMNVILPLGRGTTESISEDYYRKLASKYGTDLS